MYEGDIRPFASILENAQVRVDHADSPKKAARLAACNTIFIPIRRIRRVTAANSPCLSDDS